MMNLQPFLAGTQSVFEFIVALVVLVILHELGHFLACRLFNVDVEEFGIGIPPRAATLFVSRGTKFTLNWLPLGGFVRPKGENDPAVAGGLAAANPWIRLVVFFAGPLMNVLTGAILLSVMYFSYGQPTPLVGPALVTDVVKETPAEAAGLQVCDVITAVNGESIASVEQLQGLIRGHVGENVRLSYRRGTETYDVNVVPRTNPPPGQGALGIGLSYPMEFNPIPAGQAVRLGAETSGFYVQTLLALPVRLIQGTLRPGEGDVVGLPGMVNIYSEIRSDKMQNCMPQGFSILSFFASISLSLGIINLMPIPALDGGRIIFLLPEIVLRRRIPPERENAVNAISFIILILLLLFVNLRDIVNLITQAK